jgi:ubiquinone/menaquinone biosynthesis C-methylase UbiE
LKEVNSDLAEKVRQENILMHDRDSRIYDIRHPYMRDKAFQASFQEDLDLMGSVLGRLDEVRVLDCGAGTGNLTLKFLDFGWRVTALDISAGMLEVLLAKLLDGGDRLEIVEADAEVYLRDHKDTFDVVAFGATLHHLPDYIMALDYACKALKPGGILYVTGEPASVEQISSWEYRLLRLDEYLNVFYKVARHPRHILTVLGKVMCLARPDEVDESLAEFHVAAGLDQDRCRAVLEASGLTLLRFERFGYFGFRLVRMLARLFMVDLRSQFKLVARKN